MIRRVATLALLGLVIGSVVGMLAVGFVEVVLWMNGVLLPSNERLAASNGWRSILLVGVPTAGGLLVGLIATRIPTQGFHGLQDAIRSAQSLDARMPVRHNLLSTLAACLSLGAGASVGQYGPLAHMGGWVGSWLGRGAGDDRSLGSIALACGTAAAISAAFHAPIAGLIFSREVLLRQYSLRAFAPIAVASTMGYVVAHIVFRREPLFRVEEFAIASPYEYLVFVGIGIAGALLATLFMRAIDVAAALARRLTLPVPMRTALAGLSSRNKPKR